MVSEGRTYIPSAITVRVRTSKKVHMTRALVGYALKKADQSGLSGWLAVDQVLVRLALHKQAPLGQTTFAQSCVRDSICLIGNHHVTFRAVFAREREISLVHRKSSARA